MSTVYFISDTHFGHRNICKYRERFDSAEQHDLTITDNILSTVNKRDTLWMLGDCFFTRESLEIAKMISESVNRLHLVLGNHDTDNALRIENVKMLVQDRIVDSVHGLVKYKKAWLSHAPLHPVELRGKINIYGHVHSNSVDDERYFNACCENIDYKPIEYNEIIRRMNEQDL